MGLLNCSRNGVYGLVKKGELPFFMVGSRFRFPPEVVEAMMQCGGKGGGSNREESASSATEQQA